MTGDRRIAVARRLVPRLGLAFLTIAAWAGSGVFCTPAQAQGAVAHGTIVAEVGAPAPGLPAGTIFSKLGPPTINATGAVAFLATIAGPGVSSSNNGTVWAGAPGALELVARTGDPAPGTEPGVVFDLFNFNAPPIISADGGTAFWARVRGPGITSANLAGIWRGTHGDLQLVAREGDPAPGAEVDTVFAVISVPTGASDGGVTFPATLTGPSVVGSNRDGLWAGLPGAVGLLARTGSQAPGLPAGTNVGTLANANPAINNNGAALFIASVVGNTDPDVVLVGAPGAVQPIAVRDDPAPEVGAGITFGTMLSSPFSVNDSARASFGAILNGLMAGQNQSLWRADTSGRELLVRATDHAPGTETDTVFGTFFGFAINSAGAVAIAARVSGPGIDGSNRDGIWVGTPGNLALLARQTSVLTTPVGDFVLTSLPSGNPVLNAQGQVAFAGAVTPVGGAGTPNSVWFGTPGALSPAVISGQPIDFGGGDVRIANFIYTGFPGRGSGNQDGRPSGFSDNGQVAFLAGLPSASAIVLVPPVPPSVCGDGLITGAEQCDDGNGASGDGCSAACVVEPGFLCTGQPSVCQLTFDYTLSSSGDITVAPGAASSNTISASLSLGPSQSVSFSASGLPGGATASFSPTACIPPCSTQLTVSATATTPTGTFPITVTGAPLGRTTMFDLVVTSTCPLTMAVGEAPDRTATLASLYGFRDDVLSRGPAGQRYIGLFYKRAAEVVGLMRRHPDLRARARSLLMQLLPTVRASLAGKPATLTAADLAAIESLLEAFAASAEPGLRADIEAVLRELREGSVLKDFGISIR
jgi:cysteine-rich repeat protein